MTPAEKAAEQARIAREKELLEKAAEDKKLQEIIESNLKQIQADQADQANLVDQANQQTGNLDVSLYSLENYLFKDRRDQHKSRDEEVQNELINCGLSSPPTTSSKTQRETPSQAQSQESDGNLIGETLSFQIMTYRKLIAEDNNIERKYLTMAKLEKAMEELRRIQPSPPSQNSNPNAQAREQIPTTQPHLKELIEKELKHFSYTLDKIKRYKRHITVLETHLETGTTPRTLDRNRFPQAFNQHNPDLNKEIDTIINNAQIQMMQATIQFLKSENAKLNEHAKEKEEALTKKGAGAETKKARESIEKEDAKDKVAMDKVEKRVREKELRKEGASKERENKRQEREEPKEQRERYQRKEERREGRQANNYRSCYNSRNYDNSSRSHNNNYRSNPNNYRNSYYKQNLEERLSFPENHPYRP
jgi:hypothetical protein